MRAPHTPLSLIQRLRALVSRARLQREIDEELAFHLEMRRQRLEGVRDDDAAARLARRQFGNTTLIKEQTLDMWTFPTIESVWQDVRYALRALRRAPAFSVVAILALALGIGANVAVFSLVNAIFVNGLPYPDADRLVMLIGNVERAAVERRGNSFPDHRDWRDAATTIEAASPVLSVTTTLQSAGDPERLLAEAVDADYFRMLGATPATGRVFRPEESAVADRDAVVILSDALWKRAFGAAPGIVGQAITLDDRRYDVIGVMPAEFSGITDGVQLWIPFANGGMSLENRGSRGFFSLARLRPNATLAAAQTELSSIASRLATAYPATNAKRGVEVSPLTVETFGNLRRPLMSLMAAVVFVLLIACANVANLMISRSDVREREIALRTALGAGRARLLRQLVTESCVLAAIGAATGLLLAQAAVRLMMAASPITLPSFVRPGLDWPVVVFTTTVTFAIGIALGIVPAMHARRNRLAESLKTGARGSSVGGSARLRAALVVSEVALTVILLIGAGLMVRSVQNLAAVAPGFDTTGVLTLNLSIPMTPAAADQRARPSVSPNELLERVRAVPGVTAAGLVSDVPLGGNSSATFFAVEGDQARDASTAPRGYVHRVSADFFDTLRIPLKTGRSFSPADTAADQPSVIVSEALVARFWPQENPLGKRIKLGPPASDRPWITIIGVVGDLKYRRLPQNPTADPDLFFPLTDQSQVGMVVRSSLSMNAAEAAVRGAIRDASNQTVIFDVTSLEQLVRAQTATSRFTTWLLSAFAGAAVLLALVGLYGVTSYLVDLRRREFGIRLALGASRQAILALVLSRGALLIGLGLLSGVLVATQMARLLGALLFNVSASDPAALVAVAAMAVVSLSACLVPALRATRVDPMVALRND